MIVPSAWPQVMDVVGTPLVIEPWPAGCYAFHPEPRDRDPASTLDIVVARRRFTRFVAARSRGDLEVDERLQYAVLDANALIGEAASRLDGFQRLLKGIGIH